MIYVLFSPPLNEKRAQARLRKEKKIRGNLFLNEFEINAVDVQKALPKMVLSYAAMIHLWK
jgi:hypothetical protein